MVFVSGPIPEGRAVERHGPTHEPGGEDSLIAALLNAIYPIGHVYHSTVSTNPATLLGMPDSTWTAIATGRVLIALDAGDTDFDTVRETGGAKTHGHSDNLSHDNNHSGGAVQDTADTLGHTDGSIGSNHAGGAGTTDHSFPINHTGGGGTGDHNLNDPGNHQHDELASIAAGPGPGLAWDAAASSTANGGHQHTVVNHAAHTITNHAAHSFVNPSAHALHDHPFTQPTGHSNHSAHEAVNHMPPFYAVYVWERTA